MEIEIVTVRIGNKTYRLVPENEQKEKEASVTTAPEPSKQCTKCGIIKPITDFQKREGGRGGLNPWCRECNNKYKRDGMRKILGIETKVCSVCKEEKPLSKFYTRGKKGDASYRCKDCANEYNKKYYQINKYRQSITEKLCPKCSKIRPASAFNKSKKAKTGLQSWCRECVNNFQKKSRSKAVSPIIKFEQQPSDEIKISDGSIPVTDPCQVHEDAVDDSFLKKKWNKFRTKGD